MISYKINDFIQNYSEVNRGLQSTQVKVQILLVKYYSITSKSLYLLLKVLKLPKVNFLFYVNALTVLLLLYVILAIPLKQLTIHYTY